MCFQSEATTYTSSLAGTWPFAFARCWPSTAVQCHQNQIGPTCERGSGLGGITLAAQNLPLHNRVQCVTSHRQGPPGSVPSRLILPYTHSPRINQRQVGPLGSIPTENFVTGAQASAVALDQGSWWWPEWLLEPRQLQCTPG